MFLLERKEIFRECYDVIILGYLGVVKMLVRVRDRFYWLGL